MAVARPVIVNHTVEWFGWATLKCGLVGIHGMNHEYGLVEQYGLNY
jgi:hypothetical protein